MSGRMKKPLIKGRNKKIVSFKLSLDSNEYAYKNIPYTEIEPIIKLLSCLKKYEMENNKVSQIEDNEYISYEDMLAPELDAIGGEESFRISAHMVRSARKGSNMTQKELSEKIAVDQRNISQIEKAKRPVGKKLAKKLGVVFNLSPKVFLSDLPD